MAEIQRQLFDEKTTKAQRTKENLLILCVLCGYNRSMSASGDSQASAVLQAAQAGDRQAAADLLPLVYDELRKLAAHKLAQESPGQTLQPTALVHEAYVRVAGDSQVTWEGRRHFFFAAARAMREILIEQARRKEIGRAHV